jgi:large subunit ribosomal protein L21
MYAVIKTGGKQYSVSEGQTLEVEKLAGEVGESVEIPEVLAVGTGDKIKVGTPIVEKATVVAEIVGHGRGKAGSQTVFYKYKDQGNKGLKFYSVGGFPRH